MSVAARDARSEEKKMLDPDVPGGITGRTSPAGS